MKSLRSLPERLKRIFRAAAAAAAAAIFVLDGLCGQFNATAQSSPDFDSARVLVKPLVGVDLSALNQPLGARALNTFAAIGSLEIVQAPAGMTADTLIGLYQQNGLIQYAEHDFRIEPLKL